MRALLTPGQIIQLATFALLALAVVMVTSAGATVQYQHPTSLTSVLLNRQTLYALLAVGALLLASHMNPDALRQTRGWANPIPWALALSLGLVVLAMVPGVGLNINGSQRWLRLGPAGFPLSVTFQPSEMVKWSMVLAVALWCARQHAFLPQFRRGLLPALAVVGVACLLVVKEDLGTAALIALVAVLMLLAAGARFWHLTVLTPLGAVALVAAIAGSEYRIKRLTSFLDPFADPRGTGYQAIQSMVAIAQGGVTGRGLGQGIQKFGYLPTDTADFLYAVICEELGLAGAALVVVLYLVLLWAGLHILRQCRDQFSRLVVLGVTLTVAVQALINIAVVTVVVPTKGIALPLLSAGGTGWIMTAFALGWVVAIDRANQTAQLETELNTQALANLSAVQSSAPVPAA